MKKKIFLLSFLVLSIFLLASCKKNTLITKKTTASKTTTLKTTFDKDVTSYLTFMEINDTHGILEGDGNYLSLARINGMVKKLEEDNNQKIIRICTGDLFQGSYIGRMTYGRAFIDSLNAANYSCMVLGNHEFDWTLDKIKDYWDNDPSNGEAKFPLLCANLKDENGNRPEWVKPYTIIENNGVRVGIIGTIGQLENDIASSSLQGYTFAPQNSYIIKYSKELRQEKNCDVVVLATHDFNENAVIEPIAKNLTYNNRIDAIFCGHTHAFVERTYRRIFDDYMVPVVQSNTKNENFGVITLGLNKDKRAITSSISHYDANSSLYLESVDDPDCVEVENNYADLINQSKTQIGTLPEALIGKTNVAEIMNRAMIDDVDAKVSFVNSGGVRTSYFPSKPTIGDCFEAFPFDNRVAYFKMTGKLLRDYLSKKSDLISYSIVNIDSIGDNEEIIVATSDYVAQLNAPNLSEFISSGIINFTASYMRDILESFIKTNYPISTTSTEKIYFVSINDTHGQLQDNGLKTTMGLAEVEGITRKLEEEFEQSIIRIQVGDLFQGSYIGRMTYGRAFIDSLNAANYSCMVLGNHEFDWTLDKIKDYWDNDPSNGEAKFPLLCANLKDENGNRPEWVKPYTIVKNNGVRVGIIGTIGGNLESTIASSSLGSYSFDDEKWYILNYSKELRQDKDCDVVVLATHDYNTDLYNWIRLTCNQQNKIDAIFCGHTHASIEESYYREFDQYYIPTIQSYTKNGNIGLVTLTLNDSNNAIKGDMEHFSKNSSIYQTITPASEVLDVINNYLEIINQGEEVVGYLTNTIYGKDGVARIMNKAMMSKFGAEYSFINSGGVRVSKFENGDIKVSDCFEAFPFDNYCVVVNMTGEKLKQYLQTRKDLLCYAEFSNDDIILDKIYKVVTCDYVAQYNNIMQEYTVDNTLDIKTDIMRDVLCDYFKIAYPKAKISLGSLKFIQSNKNYLFY